jgi:hypothetical protein
VAFGIHRASPGTAFFSGSLDGWGLAFFLLALLVQTKPQKDIHYTISYMTYDLGDFFTSYILSFACNAKPDQKRMDSDIRSMPISMLHAI